MGLGFVVLLLVIYYRNRIIKTFFTNLPLTISLISEAHADEKATEAKKILTTKVMIDEVEFSPFIGLEGFSVVSSFDFTTITCEKFSDEVHQLAILLYPPESFNEKFLIKVRDCLFRLKEDHPLKQWLKWAARPLSAVDDDDQSMKVLAEVVNSQFNLITDAKLKYKIIQTLAEIPDNTLHEKILKSCLFLLIGNVTKSDNILRNIINEKPVSNWRGVGPSYSHYHRFAKNNISKIIQKLFNHPADRRVVELLGLYVSNFFSNKNLLEIIDDNKSGIDESVLQLKYIESIAPPLVRYLRLSKKSQEQRIKKLKNLVKYPPQEQSYWEWAFLEFGALKSEAMISELSRLEKDDHLWFIYLMSDERVVDWYGAKTQKSFISGKRKYLRELLNDNKTFMLGLFKIIESGDIDADLISKVSAYLTHE